MLTSKHRTVWIACGAAVLLTAASVVRAGEPTNIASAQTASAPAANLTWPTTREGLRFFWESGKRGMKAYSASDKPLFQDHRTLLAKGVAYFNTDYTMQCQGGVFLAKKIGPGLVASIKQSGQCTLQAAFQPSDPPAANQTGRLVSLESATGGTYLALVHKGNTLGCLLKRDADQPAWFAFASIKAGQDYHVIVSIGPDGLTAYVNGKESLNVARAKGAFGSWADARLLFGNDLARRSPYKGRLADVAFFARSFDAAAAKRDAVAYAARLAARVTPALVTVKSRLLEVSGIKDARKSTYPMGYAVYEWKVEEVLKGDLDSPKIRVAHWVWLENTPVKMATIKPGVVQTLVLEPIEEAKKVKGPASRFESLDFDFDIPYFYDVRPPVFAGK